MATCKSLTAANNASMRLELGNILEYVWVRTPTKTTAATPHQVNLLIQIRKGIIHILIKLMLKLISNTFHLTIDKREKAMKLIAQAAAAIMRWVCITHLIIVLCPRPAE